MAHVKSPKRQSKTVGLAKLAEELRYEWERKQRRAPAPDPRAADPDRAERKRGAGLTTRESNADIEASTQPAIGTGPLFARDRVRDQPSTASLRACVRRTTWLL
jgi:hypothetical protein